jgi:hypothetical protein
MTRPTLEVADVLRASGNSFWERQGSHIMFPHRPRHARLAPAYFTLAKRLRNRFAPIEIP